jgi:hypothetical protein
MTDLSFKNLVKTIKIAKKLGVRSMKIGSLEFVLADTLARGDAYKIPKKKRDEVALKNLDQLDFESAKDDLSTMHVEDPVGFERALIENELKDDSRGGSIEETHDITIE